MDQAMRDSIEESARIAENFHSVLTFQLLNNLEQLEARVRQLSITDAERKLVVELIEVMVKSPLRREMGKMRNLAKMLREVQKQIAIHP